MILPSEVRNCIANCLTPEGEDMAVYYYLHTGGFHPRVLPDERKAFIRWFNNRPVRCLTPPAQVVQLELIPLTTGAA